MPKRVTLTDTKIKHAKPLTKEYSLAAGSGLYLRVLPSGSKQWIFNYFKPFLKKRTNISLGVYPDLTLKRAMEERDAYNSLLANDVDPRIDREEKAARSKNDLTNTFEHAFYLWLETRRPALSPSYVDRIETAVKLYVLPGMGKIPVTALTAPYVIDLLQPLAKRQRLETLRKVCRWINEVMIYSANVGLVHSNPLAGIRKAFQAPTVTNRPTIKPEELPALMRDLEQASITLETRCAIEWLLHTLARPIEGASVRWDEIDRKKALWTIPAEKMKMRRAHIVPLSPHVIGILELMEPISGHREYVFPSSIRPREHMNPETPNMALKRMGYSGRLVAHGLRALGSTTLNEQGHDPELIEMALAHVDQNTIRATYNRADYLARRREMMDWWSAHIAKAACGMNADRKERGAAVKSSMDATRSESRKNY